MECRRLPLFPLNTVLFPGMPLPLQVFEPRYHALTRDCLLADRTFGVCLIAEGVEVGGPAVPHEIGTTCEILDVDAHQNGTLHLNCVGRERFVIRELFSPTPGGRPYPEAVVELIPEPTSLQQQGLEGLPQLTAQVRQATQQYIEHCLHAAQALHLGPAPEIPTDPLVLSWLVGAILPERADVRQQLLEAPLEQRLALELRFLEQQNRILEQQIGPSVVVAQPFRIRSPFSPN